MEVLNCTFSVKTINLQKIEIKEGDHKLSTTALTDVECVCNLPVVFTCCFEFLFVTRRDNYQIGVSAVTVGWQQIRMFGGRSVKSENSEKECEFENSALEGGS